MGYMKYAAIVLSSIILLWISLSSCTVNQQVYLNPDGSGKADVEIKLDSMLVNYMESLSEISGERSGKAIFDLSRIKLFFDQNPGLALLYAISPQPSVLRLGFTFKNIQEVFESELEGSSGSSNLPITYDGSGKDKKFLFHLDRDNYNAVVDRVIEISSFGAYEEYFRALLEPGPEELIVDMYTYAFEEFTKDNSVVEVLKSSTISTYLEIKGKLLSYKGGKPEQGGINYVIPLLRLLTLETPLEYEVIFR
mgnify:CR=1 FL=1